MTDMNVIGLAETQEELRVMQEIRRVFEHIPLHLREETCRNLIKQFPEVKITINGEEIKE